MIEVGAGCSKKADSLEAAAEASRLAVSSAGIARSDFALVFATPHHGSHYPAIIQKVKDETGATHISGCSGIGVLTHQEEIEDGPGIAVMAVQADTFLAYSFLFRDLRDRDLTVGHSIGEFVNSFSKGAELMVLFPDPYAVDAPALFSSIQEESHSRVPIIGGCASEKIGREKTYQFNHKDVASGSISGIYLTGDFTHTIGITQACHPVSGPLIVTRTEGKRIQELRGQPAMEYLAQLIQEPLSDDLSRTLRHLMIGIPVGPACTELESGKYIVRNITGIDPSDGSITTTETLSEGQTLSFVVRDQGQARQEFEEILERLSETHAGNPPRLGLYFNCAGRGNSLYRARNVDIALIRKYLGEMPLIGFFSFGEIAPINHIDCLHSFSGILTLISDPLE